MSVTASLDFICLRDHKACPLPLIEALRAGGWCTVYQGQVCYLLPGDDDLFNWQQEQISEETLQVILQEKEVAGELIGLALIWSDTNRGGNFLFYPNGKVLITLGINRKTTSEGHTDFNWYTSKIITLLRDQGFEIESFDFTESQ